MKETYQRYTIKYRQTYTSIIKGLPAAPGRLAKQKRLSVLIPNRRQPGPATSFGPCRSPRNFIP